MESYKLGIDISRHNGDIDWVQLTPDKSGISFIIHKATEGSTYQDPKFVQNWQAASAAGFQCGGYHFLRFGTSEPEAQMENFLAQLNKVGEITTNNIIALDVEKEEGTADIVTNTLQNCVHYLKNRNITPYIYTTQSFWNKYVPNTPEIIKACPLWIARWRDKEPSPSELPSGWKEWKIWQYSSTGRCVGIKGDVDLNRMIIND
ncbi:lysozyme M1-like [Uloborus diversus]|uniref:lysozyme M1-like n=1 Tax=Uloborus diversus TaxID=327109 RepID=UPI00240916AE|nr:lysozyme M1-like [Uloborus diversus]